MKHLLIRGTVFAAAAAALVGCGTLPPPAAPVAPNFVFTPAQNATVKSDISIGFLQPTGVGPFFAQADSPLAKNFIASAHADLEKLIVAKGLRSSGSFSTLDEMTFSAKEKAALVLKSTITYNYSLFPGSLLAGTSDTASVGGTVTLEFVEPLSKEKVWIKRFELPESRRPVQTGPARGPDGRLITRPDGSFVKIITQNSLTSLLNDFYQTSFAKISEQLDSREIVSLKSDAEKLKQKAGYRAN